MTFVVAPVTGTIRAPYYFSAKASPSAPGKPDLLCVAIDVRQIFSRECCSMRGPLGPLHGSIWPKDGWHLDRLSRNGGRIDFLPLGIPPHGAGPVGTPVRPFLARQESLTTAILRCAPARWAGASSIASGFPIAIEAAVVVGSKQHGRSDMANIGSFKKVGNEFQGEIVTFSVQTRGVRIVPETNRSNDNAPSHRVYVGRADYAA
jgi:hypothetical protein